MLPGASRKRINRAVPASFRPCGARRKEELVRERESVVSDTERNRDRMRNITQ